MTIQKVTTALKAAGIAFDKSEKGYLGIELAEGNWSWFVINPNQTLKFEWTYSSRTGRNKRRDIHAKVKTAALERAIGFDATKK